MIFRSCVCATLFLRAIAGMVVVCFSIMSAAAGAGSPTAGSPPSTLTGQPGVESIAGLTLLPFDNQTCRQMLPANAVSGVIIGFIAGHSPLQLCDLVVGVDGQAVQTPAQMAGKLKEALKTGQSSILLLIDRHGDKSYVSFSLPSS